jgi:large subunit ribosomal protein L7/L12
MPDLMQIVENLSQLTVLEAAELSKLLESKWGVSAAAPTAPVTAPVVVQVAEPEQEEFTVILAGIVADKKITVIKEIRAITGLGLKEAKDFTEAAGPGKVIKDGMNKADAMALKAKLEEVGAVITVQ